VEHRNPNQSIQLAIFIALFLSIFCNTKAWAVNVGSDTTLNADTSVQQNINAANVTLTNNAVIELSNTDPTVRIRSNGVTVTNNVGASIIQSSGGNRAVRVDDNQTNFTLNNSGTISSTGGKAVNLRLGSTSIINNNSTGTITATKNTLMFSNSGGTINNSGTLSSTTTDGPAINSDGTSTGLTINNNIGGVITAVSSSSTVRLDDGNTLINNGSITNTGTGFSIDFNDNNSTVTLKEGSILVGTIDISDGTTGNTIQVEQGYGQTYFYDTTGTGAYTVQDLSGNAIVKGSAGSVGQGAQESMDELLGLRTYNLRSALKRYSAFPKHLIEDELYIEPFSYYSKRGSNSSILSYENYGYGLNFIYPIKSKKFDLILTVEKSELEIQRDHDVSNINFLAGINATDLISLGPWKASGFLVAGMGLHNGKRRVFTNTTASGLLDVRSDYKNYEVITGSHANYSFSSGINTWDTEVGLTFGYSLTPDYREHAFFRWGERHLVQGSIHVGEQLTSKVNSKLNVIVGAELEHRTVLTGREQSYSINKTLAKSRNGQFWQNSVAGKLGANYSFNNNMFAYLNIDSRFSNLIRGTYGASVGLKLNF